MGLCGNFTLTIKKCDRTYNWKFCEHFLTSGNSTKAQLGCWVSILSHLFCICLTSPQSCTSIILFIIVISYVLSLNISSTLECRETHESKANQAIAASTWKKMRKKNKVRGFLPKPQDVYECCLMYQAFYRLNAQTRRKTTEARCKCNIFFVGCLVNLRLVSKILEIRHHLLRHSFLRVSNECITLLLIFIKQDHSYAKIFRL